MSTMTSCNKALMPWPVLIALTLLALYTRLAFALPLDQLHLPPGFQIELLANVPAARQMALGDHGALFIASKADRIYAIPLQMGPPYRVHAIASGLKLPIGVAFQTGTLYVSSLDRILKLPNIEQRLINPPTPIPHHTGLPAHPHHGGKVLGIGPDGWLYVPIGAPCNVCDRDQDGFASLYRISPDGKRRERVARGIRNTVGFDWHPQTKQLWFTDNGRDWMGDDAPHDELNRIDKSGQHFGFPFCHEGTIADPDYRQRPCSRFTPPVWKLGAHVAALGMRFYTGTQFPPEYRHRLFVAEHGSWNRSRKVGYRVMMLTIKDNKVVEEQPFVTGWLQGESVWGRPVDVLTAPDGSLLISDDYVGAIYRVSYRP